MENEHRRLAQPTLGLFGIGLEAYWDQFPGLKPRLQRYLDTVAETLRGLGTQLIVSGLVDSEHEAERTAGTFRSESVDLIICYVTTYATSSTVLPIALKNPGTPILILNLQPSAAMDYPNTDTEEWLANCQACCVPEIASAFSRSGVRFNVVSGQLHDDEKAWGAIEAWIQAASVKHTLNHNRCGFLGHYYPGMLDMYSDFTMLSSQTGMHVEILEMDDLQLRVDAVTPKEIQAVEERARAVFQFDDTVNADSLDWSCRVAAGLDRLVEDFSLTSLAYYYRGLGDNANERLQGGLILGASLLTARGTPCAGEADIKNAVAMLVLDSLGAGGSFTELYGMDFNDNFVLMGHDGPGHIAISDTKPILRGLGLYHGKRGHGVSVEFNVKHGPVTILGLTQTADGKLKLNAAEGESIPGPILQIGNTNSRIRFGLGPADFVTQWSEAGQTHHCALGTGHHVSAIRAAARMMDLPLDVICES